jgi:glucose/arabinose dehydrogenase
MYIPRYLTGALAASLAVIVSLAVTSALRAQDGAVLRGKAAFGSWHDDAPGKRRHILANDLPAPSTPRANGVRVVARPPDANLKVPAGFEVRQFASGLTNPRILRVAPNGDIFIAETAVDRIRVLRPAQDGASPSATEIFASGLRRPFGIAFHPADDPQWVYVGNTDSVVRFPYRSGDLKARGGAEVIVPRLPTGGHSTRDVVFSKDGTKMFVSVGSQSNVADGLSRLDDAALRRWEQERVPGAAWGFETDRAAVLVFDPQGKDKKVYAAGIRNCSGLALNPTTGDVWCSTNERDGLGDDLVPDYLTRVREGGFYGWPWYYLGTHEDPRHRGARPDLKDKVIVPDVLLQAHSASLGMTFYTGAQFGPAFRGNAFAAVHGSWNRATRTGYKIIRALVTDGVPTGEYEDFVTGFVIDDSSAWGRPVGVAEAKDGSLLFSEDGNGTVWRVTRMGGQAR